MRPLKFKSLHVSWELDQGNCKKEEIYHYEKGGGLFL